MYYALVKFDKVPHIGFAHHFYAENYNFTRYKMENSLEIAYIRQGDMEITLGEETITAPEGSVFILVRTLPFNIKANSNHSHCTVQLISDFDFEIVKGKENIKSDFQGLVLPFVTPPCKLAENIKKKLFSIVSDLQVGREFNEFSAAASAMGILEEIHGKFKSDHISDMHTSSILCYKIKKYISEHLSENISLADVSYNLSKTSIYLNSVFKKETGITIGQYINSEKIRLISELMNNKGLSFRLACESVGIADVSYGYRLFKKQMGLTPGEYKETSIIKKNFMKKGNTNENH